MMATDEVTENAGSSLVDLSPQDTAIVILSVDDTVLSCNHSFENLTGYSLEALDSLHLAQIFEPAEALHRAIQRLQTGKSSVWVKMHLRTVGGRHLPIEVYSERLRSTDSTDADIILQIHEIAPRQGQRSREANSRLLGHLAGELSHEIRNPMNAIFLHADIVEEEVRHPASGDSTQVGQSLATIKAELTRLNGLIQDYLFLARLEDFQPTPTDLSLVVEDVVYELHPLGARRGVTLDLSGLDHLGQAAVHQSAFRRALLNLLQLLIEAAAPNTTLTVSGERTDRHVQLQIHDPDNALPQALWAALQMSLRAKMPEPAELRIYVAQEILTAHGGEIALRDDMKVGRRCTITLPLKTQE